MTLHTPISWWLRYAWVASLALCGSTLQAQSPQAASPATQALHREATLALAKQNHTTAADARRGLIEAGPTQTLWGAQGQPIWDLGAYSFLSSDTAPETVHPLLWQHARFNLNAGLFRVTEGLYQLRGFDLANMTVIEGRTGLIVIDPLTSVETARAALALYFKHRPVRPVVAVIYSHSHVDHFGGVRGVLDEAEVRAGRAQVIAPVGFMDEAVSENVMAGPAMARRAHYQFGALLPRNAKGQVDAGLGKSGLPGTVSLIAPTRLIEQPTESLDIDGIRIVFELTPGAEAPAEMIMHYPDLRVLNMSEIVAHGMHNLLPLRGAKVRDALAWSKYIDGALKRYGSRSDILILQHHWPVWGASAVQQMLSHQRDLYKYLHDQTVRLMNHGYTADEIAEQLQLPDELLADPATHPFYGHLKHNIRAIVQHYLGYYDGHPARLEALPPVETARKTIAYMGGLEAVLARARDDMDRGETRWVAQIASQLVYAHPDSREARALAAEALEQLGYQMESATARNAYLQGAAELRQGPPQRRASSGGSPDVVRAMPLGLFFDFLAVRINAPRAAGVNLRIAWRVTDTQESYLSELSHRTLNTAVAAPHVSAETTVILNRETLNQIMLRQTSLAAALKDGGVQVVGDPQPLRTLMGLLDDFGASFPIVTPRP